MSVNLVTRRPQDRWIGSVGISGADLLEGDGGGRAGANVFATGPLGAGFDLRLTGDARRVAAVPLREDKRYSELEGRKSLAGSASVGWNVAPGQRLEAGWIAGQEDRWRGNVSRTKAFEDRYDLERRHGYLSWRGDFAGWRGQANLYRSELDITNTRSHGVAPTRPQNLRDDVADGHVAVKLGGHWLTVGGEARREMLANAGLAGGQDDANHKALFVQDEIALAADWTLTGGLRTDRHEFFGTEWSPRVYLVWEATPALIVKGGYGHAFKAPTLKQVSPNYVGAEGPHTFLGNADIKPETSDSIEIGADWQRAGLGLRGVLFHTRVEDLITYRLLSVVGPRRTYRYDNVNRARVNGAELGLRWQVLSALTWSADLTLLRTEDRDSDRELVARPRESLASRVDWGAGAGWSARLGLEHTGRQRDATGERVPPYTLWHMSVAKRFGKSVTMRAGVENLTDVRLAEKSAAFGYAERGRTLFASLRTDF